MAAGHESVASEERLVGLNQLQLNALASVGQLSTKRVQRLEEVLGADLGGLVVTPFPGGWGRATADGAVGVFVIPTQLVLQWNGQAVAPGDVDLGRVVAIGHRVLECLMVEASRPGFRAQVTLAGPLVGAADLRSLALTQLGEGLRAALTSDPDLVGFRFRWTESGVVYSLLAEPLLTDPTKAFLTCDVMCDSRQWDDEAFVRGCLERAVALGTEVLTGLRRAP